MERPVYHMQCFVSLHYFWLLLNTFLHVTHHTLSGDVAEQERNTKSLT